MRGKGQGQVKEIHQGLKGERNMVSEIMATITEVERKDIAHLFLAIRLLCISWNKSRIHPPIYGMDVLDQ